MKFLLYFSDFFVPMIIFYLVAYGLMNKKNVYDDFMEGAKEGFKTVIKITPTILGLMIAVGVLRASGAL
ncbi:MAG TPA: spore maturation protein, partial [Lachnospiraceae bacterium]|nr:spore maturation protein [Lachnospiraceae bacterium]